MIGGPTVGKEIKLVTRVVGIGDLVVSDDPNEMLVTYSLGSCLGVSFYDEEARVGGLMHCMLPISKTNEDRARATPGIFVDSGIVAILGELYRRGARAESLRVKLAGAASTMDENGRFQIGHRNHTVARKLLWKNSLMISSEDVGGTLPRTMRLYMNEGRTTIATGGEREL
ncbi:MAG: chemotaxis protein CheD [Planctomycetes bacterium]|nr:chemotaxis protein CheD [Planctomycetota bacterium]MCB9868721.1 chemotaxis protein CheD [Planctomycetota bacterium]MCB9889893.1 chemotaxis protein CheD [Planctomycetota bacterium]